jgi:hypothetical protein
MAGMMEQSPSAYAKMEEEHLRDQFLVKLNGHFEDAIGETFNVSGKTDVLLRERGRNVICGLARYEDRDLLFCRNLEMTTVLAGVMAVAQAHANYERSVDWPHKNPEDRNREFVLTVLLFHVSA